MTPSGYASTFPYPDKKLLDMQTDLLELQYPMVEDANLKEKPYMASDEEIQELERSFPEAY